MFGELVSSVISETRCIKKTGYPCELGRPGVRRRKRVEVEVHSKNRLVKMTRILVKFNQCGWYICVQPISWLRQPICYG